MATDVPVRPADDAAFSGPPLPFRPVLPDLGPSTRLRRVIGIREDVLDWVPEERPRYTRYGAIVVNTALLAGVSMGLALATIRAELPFVVVVVVAVCWFWVILALDSWLVASTHGVPARNPLRVLLPRLVISLLLSIFIAEPLLFQIFDKEIRQEIAVGNERKVADYRGMLVSCNPADGTSTTGRPACQDYQLKVPGSPAELNEQIKANAAQTNDLQTQVDRINKTLSGKNTIANRECDSSKWIRYAGGGRDVTETCKRARDDRDAYNSTSHIKKYQGQLADLVEKGQTLAAKKDSVANAYQPLLQRAIDTKTRQRAAALDSDGLLTRAHGLEGVAWSDWYAGLVFVVLHLLLVAIDAMPVLAKLMSGCTTYDRLLTTRFDASRKMHAEELEVQHACAVMEYEERRHRVEQETTDRMRRLEHDYGLAQAERSVRLRAELDARAARILRGTRS
ncbi:DUF4407 domain-containing protein [Streptomyces sp. NPDC001634]|uniref:DUF4407 domain-containing protein n=1 Tax=Streptomyces sp. NPDC001634 TaxID=3154390 RepID=UPI00333160E4